MEIYYYSFTGISKKLAESLSKFLNVKPKEIKTSSKPYFFWLLLSFIPYLPFKAYFEKPSSSTLVLCFPKWTFNCPPVTYFLKEITCENLFMIITYGGWGEKRYADFYRKLALKKIKKVEVFLVKKRKVLENITEVIEEIINWLNPCISSFGPQKIKKLR